MSILQISDFSNGSTKIPTNPVQDIDLQEMIDYVEITYLPLLFGVELYNLFVADLVGGVPSSPRFTTVFNPILVQDGCYIVSSDGIKEMLKRLTYYQYGREQQTRLTTVGAKQVKSENSENRSSIQHDFLQRYNDAIGDFKSIQYYICRIEPDDYPEYAGANLPFNHPF